MNRILVPLKEKAQAQELIPPAQEDACREGTSMRTDIAGTVAITGADGQVGRALLQRLKDVGAQTIALTCKTTDIPANHLVSGPLNSSVAAAAIKEADSVVHLAGALRPIGKNSYQAANVETAEAVASALKDGKAKRVLFLSYVGAREGSKNLYLRTKAMAERILAASGKEVVVFRCAHIIGSPEAPGPTALAMLAKPGKGVSVLGDGRQIVAPIYLGDVVSALQTAMKGGSPGIYDLTGPAQMSMDELVRLLNRNPRVPITHLPEWVARLLGVFLPALPGPMVDVLLRDSVGDPSRAVAMFGLKLTPRQTIWK
ncbi:MAG: NAD-dependent epimerase/dehydratase family protein [candidate division NC10 bacterium]|nr:NAD-dependent epimerase/dehydratase family protein [candidate division NC10 bacterium]